MTQYYMEPRARKYIKEYGFLSFARNVANKYKKQFLDIKVYFLKTASKKVVHKAGVFIGNKIANAVNKSDNDKIVKPDENSRNIGEIITPPEKREGILKELRQVLLKRNTIKDLNYEMIHFYLYKNELPIFC